MIRNQEIFEEIETKLAKDDYASKLPAYHPAKGRWKKGLRDPGGVSTVFRSETNETLSSGPKDASMEQGVKDDPDESPEIENPEQEEIDPERDFPRRDIDYPQKEEIPNPEPDPEIGRPDKKEFG